MRKSWFNIVFYAIILLGIIGLLFHPINLLKNIAMIAIVIGIILIIYKLFMNRSSSDTAAYRRAVKQTKKRKTERSHRRSVSQATHLHVIRSQNTVKSKEPIVKKQKRNHHNLTVIDGKKRHRKRLFFLE